MFDNQGISCLAMDRRMLPIALDRHSPLPPQQQLCQLLKQAIEQGRIAAGSKMASIRALAAQLGISRYAVLAAYEELAGMGLLNPRHGSGYYVRINATAPRQARPAHLEQVLDVALLIRGLVEPNTLLKCGSGALPKEWLQGLDLHRHLRSVAARPAANVYCYGSALGYAPLREVLRQRLARRGIDCSAEQILLTAGSTHSLELLIRCCCAAGDTVLVEAPGYYNLFSLLHLSGMAMQAVPRQADGPDLDALENMLRGGLRPRLFFMQSLLHNPTGSSISWAKAHRLLRLAEDYDFTIVDDDIYSDFAADQAPRLASLDGLQRVVYLSGFSKTISSDLRVGYIAAAAPLLQTLASIKLMISITTSEFVEQTVYQVLTHGHYERHLVQLCARLEKGRSGMHQLLSDRGWQMYSTTAQGMFIWCRHPAGKDSLLLAQEAAAAGFWFAPGSAFDPEHRPSAWLRFNVAYDTPGLRAWLATV
ncbi:PLP-dependent aminotransferase family protein [Collimonas sp. PA-H2]|uniref:aminotransferase-like domain-containing protein n=1 Tax=Collimonas sp. PA-H2 TaxID=1881062 RepID=UPI00117F818A|nr:PLP-dependent aminotransferase family protein [Collimonas sp. PA-H2]